MDRELNTHVARLSVRLVLASGREDRRRFDGDEYGSYQEKSRAR